MHISTSGSCRPVLNDSTVDQTVWILCVLYILDILLYKCQLGGSSLSCPSARAAFMLTQSAHFVSNDMTCFYFCARRYEDMVLMLLCSEAIPQCKYTEG